MFEVQKFSKIIFTVTKSRMMYFLLIVLLFMNAAPGVHSGKKNPYAHAKRLNYVVSIQQSNVHVCTGTIIDKTHVLSVAHLFLDIPIADLSVAGGGYNITALRPIKVKNVHVHPQLKRINIVRSVGEDWENDIAIIELEESIDYKPVQHTTAAFDRSRCPISSMITWLGHTRFISKQTGQVLRTENTVFRLSPDQCAEERIRVGKNQHCFIDELQKLLITSAELGSTIVCGNIMVGFVVKRALNDELGTPSTFLDTFAYSAFIRDVLTKGQVDVGPTEFPYVVSIWENGVWLCGGFILDSIHIVTAASCVQGKGIIGLRVVTAVTGASKNIVGVHHIAIHNEYEARLTDDQRNLYTKNNIAILVLSVKLPVELTFVAQRRSLGGTPLPGVICYSVNWKSERVSNGMEFKKLMRAHLKTLTKETCESALASRGVPLTAGQFCAENENQLAVTDPGSYGNPIICDEKLSGILVQTFPSRGTLASKTVFLEINLYKDFLRSVTNRS